MIFTDRVLFGFFVFPKFVNVFYFSFFKPRRQTALGPYPVQTGQDGSAALSWQPALPRMCFLLIFVNVFFLGFHIRPPLPTHDED